MAQPGSLSIKIILQENGSHVFKEQFSLDASDKWYWGTDILISTFFFSNDADPLFIASLWEQLCADYIEFKPAPNIQTELPK